MRASLRASAAMVVTARGGSRASQRSRMVNASRPSGVSAAARWLPASARSCAHQASGSPAARRCRCRPSAAQASANHTTEASSSSPAGLLARTPAEAAIDKLKADTATNGNTRPLLDHTANLLRITGGKAGFLNLVKRT